LTDVIMGRDLNGPISQTNGTEMDGSGRQHQVHHLAEWVDLQPAQFRQAIVIVGGTRLRVPHEEETVGSLEMEGTLDQRQWMTTLGLVVRSCLPPGIKEVQVLTYHPRMLQSGLGEQGLHLEKLRVRRMWNRRGRDPLHESQLVLNLL
jgi:hypothetical protein